MLLWFVVSVAMVTVVMVILLLVNITQLISASPLDRGVLRYYHGLAMPADQPASGKRWAPTEIRMNEFIHKIRSLSLIHI